MYADLLEAAGYKVMSAVDGEKVLALMHKVPNPLVIILDIMMPKMNGIDTCLNVRKMQGSRSCPILFLTALDNPQTMLECLEAGGDDFLMKTLPVQKIVERVNFWTRQTNTEKNAARRRKALRELETMISRSEEERRRLDEVADADAEPTLKKLTAFVTAQMRDFTEEDEIHRFGYLVGLFEAYAPRTIHDRDVFHFFFKKLVFKTEFIDPKRVDALLGNYQRLVRQAQFRHGWTAGRADAPLIESRAEMSQA
jgi:DNA-binding response OmpR family regulator